MTQAADGDRRAWLGAAALASVGVPAAAQPQPAGTRAALPRLARGLNLSHWFEYERGQGLTSPEMRQLRALGLDHVRLPVDPVVGGWHPQRGGTLKFLGELQQAVDMAVDAGLEVVVDLHMEPSDKQIIEEHPETERELLRLWQLLARSFADRPRTQVALELFNEPQYYGLKRLRWPGLQRQLLETVRAQAPAHLVLLSGSGGGSLESLQRLSLVHDPAVAYVYHHYAPFLFTHQGAEWQDERYTTAGLRKGLRYPPEAAHDSALPLRKPHPRAAQEMAEHLNAGWGPQRLRAEMDRAGRWAREKGVRVLCNEFGCIRANVDPPSRYRWIHDVRVALEANDIGWTLWDYTDIFGITEQSAQPGQQGRRRLDALAYGALGLAKDLAGNPPGLAR